MINVGNKWSIHIGEKVVRVTGFYTFGWRSQKCWLPYKYWKLAFCAGSVLRLLIKFTFALHSVAETIDIPALRVGKKKTLTYRDRVLCGAGGGVRFAHRSLVPVLKIQDKHPAAQGYFVFTAPLWKQSFNGFRKTKTPLRGCSYCALTWSWRESNPRPNMETICFLHA